MQHANSTMSFFFFFKLKQGLTTNVMYTFCVGDTRWAVAQLVLSKTN